VRLEGLGQLKNTMTWSGIESRGHYLIFCSVFAGKTEENGNKKELSCYLVSLLCFELVIS
jgi:hypothetical protein